MDVNDDDKPFINAVDLESGTSRAYTGFDESRLDLENELSVISKDATRSAHLIEESSDDQALNVFDAQGTRLYSLALVTDNYHYAPESALQFSPVNDNYVAWVYDDDDFGTGVVAIDLSTAVFVARWSNLDYDYVNWTREGDSLLFNEGRVYRSRVVDGDFGNTDLLFDVGEPMGRPNVNPVTNDIAYSAGGQIFSASLDVQTIWRMVTNTTKATSHPSWSPDGRYLSLNWILDPYISGADTLNARFYRDCLSVGAQGVGEGSSVRAPRSFDGYLWR